MFKKIIAKTTKSKISNYEAEVERNYRNVYSPERPLNFVSRADQRFSLLKR